MLHACTRVFLFALFSRSFPFSRFPDCRFQYFSVSPFSVFLFSRFPISGFPILQFLLFHVTADNRNVFPFSRLNSHRHAFVGSTPPCIAVSLVVVPSANIFAGISSGQPTLPKRMRSWRASTDAEFQHDLYVDADLAGDQKDSKSTHGAYQMMSGCYSHGQVKKQSCVSLSSPEAEIVSADHGISVEALPALDLIEIVLGRKTRVRVHEDNEAAGLATRSGKSPAM